MQMVVRLRHVSGPLTASLLGRISSYFRAYLIAVVQRQLITPDGHVRHLMTVGPTSKRPWTVGVTLTPTALTVINLLTATTVNQSLPIRFTCKGASRISEKEVYCVSKSLATGTDVQSSSSLAKLCHILVKIMILRIFAPKLISTKM